MEGDSGDPPLRDPIRAMNLARWELKARMTCAAEPGVGGRPCVAIGRVGRREREQISDWESSSATKRAAELC